jgi:hypothetical protein
LVCAETGIVPTLDGSQRHGGEQRHRVAIISTLRIFSPLLLLHRSVALHSPVTLA